MERQEYDKMFQQENDFWWYKTLHQIVVLSIDKNTKKNDLKIFDAGCGTGRMIALLKDKGEVSGMDFSAAAVAYSKDRGLEHIEQGDINTWEFKENYYDFIISLDVLCHESIADINDIYKRMYKALKLGGQLILNLPAFELLKRDHDICVQTKTRFRRKSTRIALEKVGFTISKATYRMPLLFIIIILQKIKRMFFKPKNIQSDLNDVPSWINSLFYKLGKIENRYLQNIGSIPFGSSLFIVATKMKR